MKRILYITYDGLTDPLGQSQVLPYLKHLSANGYRFTILSFEKRARYQKEADVVRQITTEADIEWVPLFFTAKPPVAAKVYDRWRMWRTALRLHRKNQYHMVHCRSYIAAEMGLRLRRKFGVKMLFDMRGFWADEKVDNGQWNTSKPLYKAIYRFYKEREKEFLLQADGIVSLTEAARRHLLEQPSYRDISIDVIPCCADLAHFNYNTVGQAQTEALRQQLVIPANAKVMTYLGSVGGWYMTREMFSFFKLLQERCPEYILLLLTKDDPAKVKEEATAVGIAPEKMIVTYAERAQLPAYLSLCDYSIFFIRKTFSKMASSPTKHAELMGMGIPVLCNDIGDTGEIVQHTGTGILVNAFDNGSLEKAVSHMLDRPIRNKAYIRECAIKYFDLKEGVSRYNALYDRLLSSEGPLPSQQ